MTGSSDTALYDYLVAEYTHHFDYWDWSLPRRQESGCLNQAKAVGLYRNRAGGAETGAFRARHAHRQRPALHRDAQAAEMGRASCRERV